MEFMISELIDPLGLQSKKAEAKGLKCRRAALDRHVLQIVQFHRMFV